MSLTPDYFISSSGFPQLNREKFPFEKRRPTKYLKNSLSFVDNNRKNSKHFHCNNFDKKKLLKKRGNNHMGNNNSTGVDGNLINALTVTSSDGNEPCKWITDKERKCYINQQIKELGSNQIVLSDNNNNNSSQQLDNRLTAGAVTTAGEIKYLNGIFKDNNQTEVLVLSSLEF